MPTQERRPNVLVFIPHDLGDNLHCCGHPQVRSPNLDRLAQRGVRFSEYFCVSPECSPSRGGMMTGYHVHENGMLGLAPFGWVLRKPHLAKRMAELGYDTHLFGFQHETHETPETLGYSSALKREAPQGERRGDTAAIVCEDVRAFVQSEAASAERPWFACAGFADVHRPWKPETSFDADTVQPPPFLPDNPTIRSDLARFYQSIMDMDAAVGGAIDELDRTPAAADTLVIFTTDHGAAFPRAKATLYDPGIRIPLIMRLPGRFEGGRVCDELLSNVDFTPTVLDLCGAPSCGEFTGRSFAPLLRGQPYEPRDQIVSSLFYDVAYDPMHCVRTREFKYIRSFAVTPEEAKGADPETLATHVAGQWIRVDDFDVMASDAWQSMKTECPKPPREELYDLRSDPWEQNNLAQDPAAQDTLDAMRARLDEWMTRTDSPLRSGHPQPPDKQRSASRHYAIGGPAYQKRGLA